MSQKKDSYKKFLEVDFNEILSKFRAFIFCLNTFFNILFWDFSAIFQFSGVVFKNSVQKME